MNSDGYIRTLIVSTKQKSGFLDLMMSYCTYDQAPPFPASSLILASRNIRPILVNTSPFFPVRSNLTVFGYEYVAVDISYKIIQSPPQPPSGFVLRVLGTLVTRKKQELQTHIKTQTRFDQQRSIVWL